MTVMVETLRHHCVKSFLVYASVQTLNAQPTEFTREKVLPNNN